MGKKDMSKDCTALYKYYTHYHHQFILPLCSFQKSLKIVAVVCINACMLNNRASLPLLIVVESNKIELIQDKHQLHTKFF